jgi:hypothetical protein
MDREKAQLLIDKRKTERIGCAAGRRHGWPGRLPCLKDKEKGQISVPIGICVYPFFEAYHNGVRPPFISSPHQSQPTFVPLCDRIGLPETPKPSSDETPAIRKLTSAIHSRLSKLIFRKMHFSDLPFSIRYRQTCPLHPIPG